MIDENSEKITVIMPVYNASKYLAESIESILNQSYRNYFFYIINDKSTDNSLDIILEYAKKDSRIKVVDFEENKGQSYSRNYGIKKATTPYVALMDADDISNLTRFEKQLNFLEKNSDIDVCGSWFTIFGDIKTETIKHLEKHDDLKLNLLIGCYIGNPTVMSRRESINLYEFKKEFNPMEDYQLWSEMIYNHKFHNIQESLLEYRWHENNISKTANVNREKLHAKIRFNQLKNLDITGELKENEAFLLALQYIQTENLSKILKIFKAAHVLKSKNKKLQVYNVAKLNELVNQNIVQIIKEVRKFNLKVLLEITLNHYDLYKELTAKQKRRFIKRCLYI